MATDKEQEPKTLQEPGRTATEAEGGEESPRFPHEESRQPSHAEGSDETEREASGKPG